MNTFNTFKYSDWITLCLLNIPGQVIRNVMYAVESKFVLPKDVNPVRTHYVVSEFGKFGGAY